MNAAIAAELGAASRTVGAHILATLGVGRRAEIAVGRVAADTRLLTLADAVRYPR